jgi:serine/threonine protein kinase
MDASTYSPAASLDRSSSTSSLADLPFSTDLPVFQRKDLTVGRLLGRGRFSQVHAIDDHVEGLPEDRTYVMKHLQRKLFENRSHRRFAKDLTNALADLVLEAMYLSKFANMNHPHIVKLRGLTMGGTSVLKREGATHQDYFLILDRMEETLDQRIRTWKKQHPANNTTSLLVTKTEYALQIASALQFLHSQRILYRDCKPENIGFTSGDNTLQLFDFGLARELAQGPEEAPNRMYTLSASGTRRYMAPEIFLQRKYGYKADCYSFAMVFYELLAMTKPFADFTTASHEELVCRLGGRPRLSEIEWPCDDDDDEDNSDDTDDVDASEEIDNYCPKEHDPLPQDVVDILQQAWSQSTYERLSMADISERLHSALERHERFIERQQHLKRISNATDYTEDSIATTTSAILPSVLQQHLQAGNVLKKKQSTSELTVSTDPIGSDSE